MTQRPQTYKAVAPHLYFRSALQFELNKSVSGKSLLLVLYSFGIFVMTLHYGQHLNLTR